MPGPLDAIRAGFRSLSSATSRRAAEGGASSSAASATAPLALSRQEQARLSAFQRTVTSLPTMGGTPKEFLAAVEGAIDGLQPINESHRDVEAAIASLIIVASDRMKDDCGHLLALFAHKLPCIPKNDAAALECLDRMFGSQLKTDLPDPSKKFVFEAMLTLDTRLPDDSRDKLHKKFADLVQNSCGRGFFSVSKAGNEMVQVFAKLVDAVQDVRLRNALRLDFASELAATQARRETDSDWSNRAGACAVMPRLLAQIRDAAAEMAEPELRPNLSKINALISKMESWQLKQEMCLAIFATGATIALRTPGENVQYWEQIFKMAQQDGSLDRKMTCWRTLYEVSDASQQTKMGEAFHRFAANFPEALVANKWMKADFAILSFQLDSNIESQCYEVEKYEGNPPKAFIQMIDYPDWLVAARAVTAQVWESQSSPAERAADLQAIQQFLPAGQGKDASGFIRDFAGLMQHFAGRTMTPQHWPAMRTAVVAMLNSAG